MSSEYTIEVKNVKKKFKVYYDKGRSLKEKVLFRNRNRYEEHWVLNGISFNVKKGEAIGIIGHNGCGKSTTLKLLTKIMYPDEGSIEIKGRVSSLIELGAGFHPDMSGRENIYTNASIFGLTRKEIDARLQDIIEFSELEEYLDNPVRTYSSGMYMRLAFSVAINVDADVLLVDEILAVGDINFQAKCFNKLREIKANGTTIVIVSHSLGQIEQICDRTIWIQDGLIKTEGAPRVVHPEYMDFMGQKRQDVLDKIETTKPADDLSEKEEAADALDFNTENNAQDQNNKNYNDKESNTVEQSETVDNATNKRWGNGKVRISNITTFSTDMKKKSVFSTGDSIILKIEYKVLKKVEDAVFGIAIYRSDGLHCYGVNTRIDNLDPFDIEKDGYCQLLLENVNLLPGEYFIDVAIEAEVGIPVDYYREAHKIELYSVTNDVGSFRIDHKWSISN
jgi:ABC-2 type transport system ATP-binding protein